jgi:hypothetical protein
MLTHRHALHFQRPLSPLGAAQQHVKDIARRNAALVAIAIVGMAIVGMLAIALYFYARTRI